MSRSNISRYHSSIKWELLEDVNKLMSRNKSISILDLCVGRGGDIFKYVDTFKEKLTHIVGLDIDSSAIEEAKRRVETSEKKISCKIDLDTQDGSKSDLETTIRKYSKKKFDLICCNFAIHYFFKNEEALDNIINVVKKLSKKNTIVWFTFPDGNSLKELLSSNSMNIKNKYYELSSKKEEFDKVFGGEVRFRLVETTYFKTAKPGEQIIQDNTSTEYFVTPNILTEKLQMKLINQNHFDHWFTKFPKIRLHFFEKQISSTNLSMMWIK